MYNRYIPGSERGRREAQRQEKRQSIFSSGFRSLWDSLHIVEGGTKNAGIAGIFQELGFENLDSGDVLLLLILLLVFLEGNNTELVITLALMLLLGEESS